MITRRIGRKQYFLKLSEILQVKVTVNANRKITIIKQMTGS